MNTTALNTNIKGKVALFFLFSFLMHLGVVVQHIKMPKYLTKVKKEKKQIAIKIVNAPTSSKVDSPASKNIVFTSDSKEILKDVKPEYFGKKKNTFARQTRARKSAAFNEGGKGGIKSAKKKTQAKKANKRKKVKNINFGNLAPQKFVKQKNGEEKKNSGAKAGVGSGKASGIASSFDSLSKDIPLGDFNKVNTQEHIYFSFYERIKKRLEVYWGENIQSTVDKFYVGGRSIASVKKITALEVTMDDNGEIVHISLKTTSGYKELDSAAIDAFNKAGPFPNPPKQLVKNGKAKIKWGFEVN